MAQPTPKPVVVGTAADLANYRPSRDELTHESDTGIFRVGDGNAVHGDLEPSAGAASVSVAPADPVAASAAFAGVEDDPNGAIVITAVTPGSAGNVLQVTTDDGSTVPPESVAVTGPSGDSSTRYIRVTLTTPTASQVVAAINGFPEVAGLVTASLAPGSDGSGLVLLNATQLSGGADTRTFRVEDGMVTASLLVIPNELDQPALVMRPALGSNLGAAVLNILHRDGTPNDVSGYGVSHLDSDGGGGFADGAVSWSEAGNLTVNPLSGAPLFVGVAGYGLFTVSAQGSTVIGASAAGVVPLIVYPYTGSTEDSLQVYAEDGMTKTLYVGADGVVNAPLGVAIKSPDGSLHVLTVANDGTVASTPA